MVPNIFFPYKPLKKPNEIPQTPLEENSTQKHDVVKN